MKRCIDCKHFTECYTCHLDEYDDVNNVGIHGHCGKDHSHSYSNADEENDCKDYHQINNLRSIE